MEAKYKEIWGIMSKDYTKEDFLNDLKKVCRPIKKTDKHKPSSEKT